MKAELITTRTTAADPNPFSSLQPHEVYRARENEIGHCAFIVFL